VRQAEDYFDGIKKDADLNEEQLELAEELVNRKTASFDPKRFKDLYQEGLKEIITAKLEKRPAKLQKGSPPPGNVVNIVDALRKSLEQSNSKESTESTEGSEKKRPLRKTKTTKRKSAA
jgi:DNA end-binding protein Ku